MAVGASGWSAVAEDVTPAAAGTAKTVLSVISAANKSLKLTEFEVGFIGASGAAKPVRIELCQSTQAGAGSGSSSVTPVAMDSDNSDTVNATAKKGYTSEPTVLTVLKVFRCHPQAGMILQFPLGREPKVNNGYALCLRVTFETGETTTNIDVAMEFEE